MSEDIKKDMNIEIVPLNLMLEDKHFIDDENLDIKDYIRQMNACKTAPKTSAPSPHDFMKSYEGNESVFVVTLSSKLSGTYNSALVAKKMFLKEVTDKFIHVLIFKCFNCETLICLKINELAKSGNNEIEIVDKVMSILMR